MKFSKITLLTVLIVTMCLLGQTVLGAYSVEEFGVENINPPEDYISCTKTQCDEELETIIVQNGFSGLSDWVSRVMEPSNIYFYSSNKKDLTKCMYVICKNVKISKTNDGLVEHKLARDYNMCKDEGDKATLLDTIRRAAGTDNVSWAPEIQKTPFIEYETTDGINNIHAYCTIYGGIEYTLQFSSAKKFTEEERDRDRIAVSA